MKKLFYIAVAVILTLILLLVGYGALLNYYDEKNIAVRLENRVIRLEGVRASKKLLQPAMIKTDLRLTAENMTDAVSRLEGTVAEVYVQPKQKVTKGQPVCRIINEDIDMKLVQADVSIAKAATLKARYANSLSRYKRLIDIGAVSLEQYEDVETQYKSTAAELETLELEKRQYELLKERLTVTSPLDGEVLMVYKKPGAFLQAGTSVALVGNFSHLSFTETLNEEQFSQLLPLDGEWKLAFASEDLQKIYAGRYGGLSGQGVTAHVISADPPAAAAASLRSVTWEIDNSSGLLEPKLYQNVSFRSLRQTEALAVPLQAVDMRQGTVFVWQQDGALVRRRVRTGVSDGSFIAISSGLEEGEIVVTSGREGLQEGMQAEVVIEEAENGTK